MQIAGFVWKVQILVKGEALMPRLYKLTIALIITTLSLPHQNAMGWSTTRASIYNEKVNTHLWLLRCAIELMKRSERDEIRPIELDLITAWKKRLEQGIHHADWKCVCNTFFLFGTHYYNPDNGRSFIPSQTAKDMGVKFFKKAGTKYQQGNMKKAFYYLGLSLHYVTDITQPMHAALFTDWNISMPKYHHNFENYAMSIQDQFMVPGRIHFENYVETTDPGAWIHKAAEEAKRDEPLILNKKLRNCYLLSFFSKDYEENWKSTVTNVIGNRLIAAQLLTARFIHLWFRTYVL